MAEITVEQALQTLADAGWNVTVTKAYGRVENELLVSQYGGRGKAHTRTMVSSPWTPDGP